MDRKNRLKIGKMIYTKQLTRFEAAEMFKMSPWTMREYMREYRDYLKEVK